MRRWRDDGAQGRMARGRSFADKSKREKRNLPSAMLVHIPHYSLYWTFKSTNHSEVFLVLFMDALMMPASVSIMLARERDENLQIPDTVGVFYRSSSVLRIHESSIYSIRFLPIDCSLDLPVFMQEGDRLTNCPEVFRVFLRRARSEFLLSSRGPGTWCFLFPNETHAHTNCPNTPCSALYFSFAQTIIGAG